VVFAIGNNPYLSDIKMENPGLFGPFVPMVIVDYGLAKQAASYASHSKDHYFHGLYEIVKTGKSC
jgi:hypothetical protein